jgi:hypothetical protein
MEHYCDTLMPPKNLWGDFPSLYSQFYEVIILESTYAIGEGKVQVYF